MTTKTKAVPRPVNRKKNNNNDTEETELDELYKVTDTETSQDSTLRCKRCTNCHRYIINENSACKYHQGKYMSQYKSALGLRLVSWTCCGSTLHDAPPCKTASKHISDHQTEETLKEYDHILNYVKETKGTITLPVEEEKVSLNIKHMKIDSKLLSNKDLINHGDDGVGANDSQKAEEINRNLDNYTGNNHNFIIHHVQYVDTLKTIALKYKVSIKNIKEANHLHSDDIRSRSELFIPSNGSLVETQLFAEREKIKEAVSAKFMREQKVGLAEAKYYLKETSFDYNSAVKLRQSELKFEK